MPKNKNSTPRTKGGAKPANSDAAVNFLLNKAPGVVFDGTGVNLVCFSGFSSSSDNTIVGSAGYVPPVTGSKEIDATVDEDLRLTLRKLSKKDVVTKRKALSEFFDLVNTKSVEALQGALPFWPALLSRLSLDDDWRIREATHRISGALGARLGRHLLPYLKQIIPWWLAGQCDTYDPVVCASEAAFNSTFNSDERRSQACKLAIVEIVEIVSRLVLTSVPLKAAGEESAARHAHFACVGLQMLGRIVSMSLASEMEPLRHLLTQKTLWKLDVTPTLQPQLARSLYSVAEALCKASGDLLICCNRFVCRCVLSSLDGGANLRQETDLVVTAMLLPSIWSAALALHNAIEPVEAWAMIGGFAHNGRASLRRLFHGAGLGAARTIYPYLLPFLSRLPLDAHSTSGSDEIMNLLDAMLVPLHSADSTCLLPLETAIAVARASMEFARYLLAAHASHETEECSTFCEQILTERILPLVRKAMCFLAYKQVRVVVLEQWFGLWCFLVKRQAVGQTLLARLLTLVEASWGVSSHDVEEKMNYGYIAASYMKLLQLTCSPLREHAVAASKKVSFVDDSILPDLLPCADNAAEQLLDDALPRLRLGTFKSAAALLREDVSQSWLLVLAILQDMPSCATAQICGVTLRMLEEHGVHLLSQDESVESGVLDAAAAGVALLLARAEDRPEESLARVMGDLANVSAVERLQTCAMRLLPCLTRAALEHGSFKFQRSLEALLEPFALRSVEAAIQAVITDPHQIDMFSFVLKLFFVSLVKESSTLDEEVEASFVNSRFYARAHRVMFEKMFRLVSQVEMATIEFPANALFLAAHFVAFLRRQNIEKEHTAEFEVNLVHQYVTLLLHRSIPQDTAAHVPTTEGTELDDLVTNTVFDALARDITTGNQLEVRRCVDEVLSAVSYGTCFFTTTLKSFLDRLVMLVFESVGEDASAPLFQIDFASEILVKPVEDLLLALAQTRHQLGCLELDPLSISTRLLRCESARQLSCGVASEVMRLLSPIYCVSSEVDDMCAMEQRLLRVALIATTLLRKLFPLDELTWLDSVLSSATHEQMWFAVRLVESNGTLGILLLEALGGLPTVSDGLEEKLSLLSENCLSNFMLTNSAALSGLLMSSDAVFEQLRVCVPTLLRLQPAEWYHRLANFLKERAQCHADMSLKVLHRVFILSALLLEHAHSDTDNLEGFVEIVRLVVTLRDREDVADFLLDSADQLNDEHLVLCNSVLARFLIVSVDKAFHGLDRSFWDFLLCNAVAWISTLFDKSDRLDEMCERTLRSDSLCQFAVQVLFLIQCIGRVVDVRLVENKIDLDEHASSVCAMSADDWENLTEEWNHVFCDNIFQAVLSCFKVVRSLLDDESKVDGLLHLESLSRGVAAALSVCPSTQLLTYPTPPNLVADDILSLPGSKRHQNLLSVFRHFLRPLHLNKGALLLGVFEAWRALSAEMAETMEIASVDLEQVPLTQSLLSTLNCCVESKLFANLMSSSRVDELLLGRTYEADRHLLAAYLFAWHVVLQMFELAAAELRAKVAAWLESTGMFFVLLSALVRLVPPAARAEAWNETAIKGWRPDPRVDSCSAKTLRQCACALIYRVFRAFPALSRVWWLSLDDKRLRSHVDNLVERCLSPLLCSEECQRATLGNLSGLTIRSRMAVREVAAVYQVTDEHSAELVIKLAPNHPLGAIQVEATRHVGVPQNQWRAWQMQLTVFLQNQNGSILDGLALWRRNLEKKFEGVEDCTICYSILHGSTYQLPRMQCRTCRKRFHAACMLRWFQSSGNPSCPLCRNLFDVAVAGERF